MHLLMQSFFFFLFLSGTLLKYFGAGAQPTPPAPDVSTTVSASTADDTAGEVFLDGKWLHSLLIWHDTFNIVIYLFIYLFVYLFDHCRFIHCRVTGTWKRGTVNITWMRGTVTSTYIDWYIGFNLSWHDGSVNLTVFVLFWLYCKISCVML